MTDTRKDALRVVRGADFNAVTRRPGAEWFEIDGVRRDLTALRNAEYQRANSLHPDNPAYHMRPMFYTGSPYADELLALIAEGEGA